MKFLFKDKESKLYDFLKFPKCFFYQEIYSDLNVIHDYDKIIDEGYMKFLKEISDKLSPFSKEIEIFYSKLLFDFDFIDLIKEVHKTNKFENSEDYLKLLLSLSENDIKESIIYTLIMNDNQQINNEIHEEIKQLSSSNDKILKFINELPIDARVKWNLFLIIQEPIKYMKIYFDLMNKILPIFETIYKEYEEEVIEYGNYLINYLNKSGPSGIEEMTNSFVNKSFLLNEENEILVSVIFPYAITLLDNEDKRIVWGIKIEEAIKKVNELNENKLNERIQIFKNLGDKTRYEVLKLISQGITSTKEIATTLGVSSATISYHINNFITSKLIKMDNTNKKFSYVVDYKLLNEIISGLKEDLKFPDTIY